MNARRKWIKGLKNKSDLPYMKAGYVMFYVVLVLASQLPSDMWGATSHCYFYEDAYLLYLGNDFIKIVLSKDEKGGIYSVIDRVSEQDFRRQKTVPCEIFNINVSPDSVFSQHSAATFSHFTSMSVDNLTLHLVWMHFPINLRARNSFPSTTRMLEDSMLPLMTTKIMQSLLKLCAREAWKPRIVSLQN